MTISSQINEMTSLSDFFDVVFFSLVRFIYWYKFHVNIITGFWSYDNLFYKGFTRNLEIGTTHVSVFPNIWRLGQVRDTKFGMSPMKYMLQNVRVTAFTISELLRENQQGEGGVNKIKYSIRH